MDLVGQMNQITKTFRWRYFKFYYLFYASFKQMQLFFLVFIPHGKVRK